MAFKFNPCRPCCTPAYTKVIAGTERLGSGWVVALGDGNIIQNSAGDNGPLWNCLQPLAGAGAWGCPGPLTTGSTMYWPTVPVNPTVPNVNSPAALAGLGGLYVGHNSALGVCANYQLVPSTMYADVGDWVRGGGVLVVVAEWATCAQPAVNAALNALLAAIGATTTFDYVSLSPFFGFAAVVPTHPFVDGTVGSIARVYYAASTRVNSPNPLAYLA